ncbi:S-adenosylmethionine uptake transporter [Sphingomonas guangdongensis]|uniref:S-adenosylmethionine uptake transporter n=1 Tax=Sphingomonas guangdongensis TaxID=1141890 RepID=A0A285QXL9_9SPHN|nr:DMT family transporter [Sphingomonas guangdongensis]SOB86710.1 S-adenosylmethionine uptake transporter [Sphingomonas guangdongensis]
MPDHHPRAVTPVLAFALAAAGIGLFSVMDAFMKSLTLALGVYNALIWRTGTSVLIAGAVWGAAGRPVPSGRALRLHLLRGSITAAMALLFFWGLARVPMAQAISLAYVAPLLALLLGAWLLGERVGRRVALASLLALGGVGIILAGHGQLALGPDALWGAGAILASAVLYAGNLVVARLQSQAAVPAEIAFVQSLIVTAILLTAAPWLLHLPPAAEWWKIAVGAALGTGSLFLLAWAYAHGETGYLATTEYTSFVYAAVLGWLVFGERVAATTLLGAAVIVAACLWGARRGADLPAAVEAGA